MSNKKIFVEALGLVDGHFSGVGQYIAGILHGIDAIIEREKLAGNDVPEVQVIIPYDTLPRFKSFGFKYLKPKLFPIPFYIMGGLDHKGKLPPLDIICGRGTYVFTRFSKMPLVFSKSMTVVYDLSFELFSQYSDENNARFLSARVRLSMEKSDKIITISQNAKKEIIDFYSIPATKVIVATPAVDRKLFYRRTPKEIESVKRKYEIEGNYILALSNLEPRKNLDSLIDVYCDLPEETRKDTGLLLVGVNGWKIEKLFDKILKKIQDGNNIMRPSKYVSDEDKPAIISGASMLVYPSHYEGFGMPPLEALACGTPVIAADNSSLPEVIGHAGKMVPSSSRAKLHKAVTDHLNNLTAITNSSVTAGPLQAEKFSWEESAQVIWDEARGMS